MRRTLPALCSLAFVALNAMASQPRLDADTAQRDLRILKRALTELHPGIDRYTTPEALDAAFAAANAEVAQGADLGTMLLLASRLSAAVRCGHTWTNPLNQSAAIKSEIFGAPDKLPVWLRLIDGRFLVVASADPGIADGSELLAIDGRPVSGLIAELLPYLRADGSNDGKRLAQLDSDENGGAMDRLFPLLHPPVASKYRLRIRDAAGREQTVTVAAISVAVRDQRLARRGIKPLSDAWTFKLQDGLATLTLPTFSFWRSDFDWKGELARAFATINAGQASGRIQGLILDLRRNEGGDDAIGNALLAYLLTKPYTRPASTPYSRYERVPYALARYLDTWDFSFFDRTGQVTKLGERLYRVDDQIEPPHIVEPVADTAHVPVVALTGPQMSSAGYLIARDLKASGAALLIGRTTGGNLRGLNGGQLAWITLPGSGVAVDLPLIAWKPEGTQPDAGVVPDITVSEDFEAIRAGRDPDMEAARARLGAASQD